MRRGGPHTEYLNARHASPHTSGVLGLWRNLGLGIVVRVISIFVKAHPRIKSGDMLSLPTSRRCPSPFRECDGDVSPSGHSSALGLPRSDPRGTRTNPTGSSYASSSSVRPWEQYREVFRPEDKFIKKAAPKDGFSNAGSGALALKIGRG